VARLNRSRIVVATALAALCLAAPPADAAKKKPKVATPVAAPAPPPPSVSAGVDLWRAGDYAAAVAVWQPFAAAGDADAMFNMGQAYKLGRAVPKDLSVARDFYRKAAAKSHLPAQANLGILLFQAGEKPEATRWLKTAADRNEMRAQYVLGIAHWNGDGVPRSLPLAYAYLLRASAQGLTEAATALNTLNGIITPLDRANGGNVANSLAAGEGIPSAAPPAPPPVAAKQSAMAVAPLNDVVSPDQVIKAAPRPAEPAPERTLANSPQITATPPLLARKPAAVPQPVPVTPPAGIAKAPAVSAERAEATPSPEVSPVASRVTPPVTTVALPLAKPPVVTKPPEKPVAKPPVKKITGWRVQLGAFSKRQLAENAWKEFAAKQKKLIGDRKPIYAVDGNVTRLQFGPYKNKADAREACDLVAKSGRACFATDD
jgi:hypothetical protein